MRKRLEMGGILAGILLAGMSPALAAEPADEAAQAFQQGIDAMARKNYVAAEEHFDAAKEKGAANPDYARDVDARRAALYIQNGEASRAVHILRPYLEGRTATSKMISDYLMALRMDNKGKEAVKEFRLYVPDWSQMPTYGLQSMGDTNLRLGNWKEAHALYSYITDTRHEDIGYVRLGDAYALVMMGEEAKGIKEYEEVAKAHPELQPVMLYDGENYLRKGMLHPARALYSMLGQNAADREKYQLQYGRALTTYGADLRNSNQNFFRDEAMDGRSYYHEAEKVYRSLLSSTNPDTVFAARVGLAANKQQKGLYADSGKEIDALLLEHPNFPPLTAAGMDRVRIRNNDLSISYSTRLDNKRNHETSLGADYTNYLGGNVYGLFGYGHSWLQDGREHASYTRGTAGAAYRFGRGQLDLLYNRYMGFDLDGYQARLSYELNDVSRLIYAMGRRPHDSTGAIKDKVSEHFYSIRMEHILNDRWRLGAAYEWDTLSDGNRYWSAGLDAVYRMDARNNYRDNLLFSASRGHYSKQMDAYDSPYRQQSYSVGWSRKWNIGTRNRTIEWTNVLAWGHDNDEGEGFSPYSRLEFVQSMKANQRLSLGAQVNGYFNQISGGNRRNNGFLFDLSYEIGW